ncbi:hypothetical protein [Microbaculum marinum]|uniref:Uncharacterized protein n=1 Tax=Microbaculum marinum TaxID=1764581 RepID=A0AAW9RW72_9HYPH
MSDALTHAVDAILDRGDLAHLALFLWACAATGLAWFALRELSRSNRRFEEFVTAVAYVERLLRNRGR